MLNTRRSASTWRQVGKTWHLLGVNSAKNVTPVAEAQQWLPKFAELTPDFWHLSVNSRHPR